MSGTSDELIDDRVGEGWDALANGRWEEARHLFENALEDEESGATMEGLSWAAWWLDDATAVFDARERAYAAYRKAGDAGNAAYMAAWLAADALDFHGAVAVASGWLQRAERLLEPLETGPAHGWLHFFEGYLAYAAGETSRAGELAVLAAKVGRRASVPDLEMLGLALEGATLVGSARVDEGMRRLDEATARALEGEATIPISGAWACCFLVSACTAVRDYERASEWCDRIAVFAERYGNRYMLAFCRAEYGSVQLWRGRWSDAETLLLAAVDDFARSRPALVGAAVAELAELRRRQGRVDESAALLARASSPAALLGQARLALDRGDVQGAVDLAERVLRKVREESELGAFAALELLVRAAVALGDLEHAGDATRQLRRLEGRVGTAPLRAAADLAEGTVLAAVGDHERARALLEDAVDGFERSAAAFEAAHARLELAACLLAAGRSESAAREAEVARERLERLGAEPEARRAERLRDLAHGDEDSVSARITRRERDVLRFVAEGLTNQQIAERLVVSEHTVHRHVTNILRKLDLPSRAAAAAFAVRSGLAGQPGE